MDGRVNGRRAQAVNGVVAFPLTQRNLCGLPQ